MREVKENPPRFRGQGDAPPVVPEREAASVAHGTAKKTGLWQKYRPRWNRRDRLTFWLPLMLTCVAAVITGYSTEIRTVTVSKIEELREAVVDHPDFAVKNVEVTGRIETPRDFVLSALDIDETLQPVSSLEIDVEAARARLLESPWIEEAAVALDPTGTLRLRLSERAPAAIWRTGDVHWLIDEYGKPIQTVEGPRSRLDLPYLIGIGADTSVADARRLLSVAPAYLVKEILALVRRGDRRWDAVSKYGFLIRLPAEGAPDALRAYGRSNLGERLKRLAVVALDLRRPEEPPVLTLEDGVNDLRLDMLADLRRPDPKPRQ